MDKVKVRLVNSGVECYDFETKTDIKGDEPVEAPYTQFIQRKIREGILEEVRAPAKGGDVNDTGKSGKSKKKSKA